MKRILFLTLLVLALGGGVLALAGQVPDGDGLIPRETFLRTLVRLDLTEAQKRDVAAVLKSHKGEARAAFDRVRAAAEHFRKATASPAADEAAVRLAFRDLAAAGEEAVVVKSRIMAEVRGKLTPEQQKLLLESRDLIAEKVRERVETARAIFEEWIEAHTVGAS
ncbi:MAG: periplasmic heavy metal sensor [Desulfovibrionaceae bacterium]|nr:periplasmic heavy metal sensor [Desulfovibrionaceae bacterium]